MISKGHGAKGKDERIKHHIQIESAEGMGYSISKAGDKDVDSDRITDGHGLGDGVKADRDSVG